jgi:hypothetical protein
MKADEVLKEYMTMQDPNNYGSIGTRYRITQTSPTPLLRDQGYGRKLVQETSATLPHGSVSSRRMPYSRAPISPTFNRPWHEGYGIGRMHTPASSRSRLTPSETVGSLLGAYAQNRSNVKQHKRRLAERMRQDQEWMSGKYDHPWEVDWYYVPPHSDIEADAPPSVLWDRQMQEQVHKGLPAINEMAERVQAQKKQAHENHVLSYIIGRDVTATPKMTAGHVMAPTPGPRMAPAPVSVYPRGPQISPMQAFLEDSPQEQKTNADDTKKTRSDAGIARKRNTAKDKENPPTSKDM